ncbi:MAG: sulfite reductase [Arcobacter sp.]|nr:MAG: sulfite reductase [Arcobacter sp.]
MYKKVLFKIHLVLGLTAGIVLLVVGLTGSLLSFDKEILHFVNQDSYIVEISDKKRLSTKELLEKFKEKFPQSKVNGITFSKDLKSTVVINIAGSKGKAKRRGINYYINPYTAEVLPNVEGQGFFKFIENIHRRLAAGDVGKQIVGASVLCLLLLMFSGVYIYWPRVKRAFFKSFTFSFKYKGRAFISAMHSAIGMWVIPFYLLASLTGLYWSYDFFNEALHKISGVEKQRKVPRNKKPEVKRDLNNTKLKLNEIQETVELFHTNIKDYTKANFRFNNKKGVYSISYLEKTSVHERARNQVLIDINTKKIVKHEKFEDKPLNERLMKSILALHTGEYFGLVGQIAMFISSLFMVLFTVTGFIMYFKRKRKKQKV